LARSNATALAISSQRAGSSHSRDTESQRHILVNFNKRFPVFVSNSNVEPGAAFNVSDLEKQR